MAEATALRNNALPYPVYGAPYTVSFPILDADGDLVTGAASLDSEVSKNGDTFADCTNEATEIATSSGMYYLTLTGTEMTADVVTVIVKTSTSGAKTTALTLYPRKLVTLATGTSQGGDTGYITLAAATVAYNGQYNGCLCVAVIDTVTEARILQACTASNQQCTVTPTWNTAPDADDTYTIYLLEGMQLPTANTTMVSGMAQTAGDIYALLSDVDAEIDDIHTVVHSIAVTGSALNKEASSFTKTTGGTPVNDYTYTAVANGLTHDIPAASNALDVYYEFNVGTSGIPAKCNVTAALAYTGSLVNQNIDLYFWRWDTGAWDLIKTNAFVAAAGNALSSITETMIARHVEAGVGTVRVRFYRASGLTNTTTILKVDQILIEYAESTAALIALVKAQTDKLTFTGTDVKATLDGETVVLAASQPSYAPAKAGDEMDLVDSPNPAAVAVIGAAAAGVTTPETIDALLSANHGDGQWGAEVILPSLQGTLSSSTISRGEEVRVSRHNSLTQTFSLGIDCTDWTATFSAKLDQRSENYIVFPVACTWTDATTGAGTFSLTPVDTAIVGAFFGEITITKNEQVLSAMQFTLRVMPSNV